VFLPDSFEPLALFRDKDVLALECDQVGFPRLATNARGQVVWQATYLGFGRLTNEISASEPVDFRFQGQIEDRETGLFYNRFRYYDPDLRMYLSPDPVGLDGSLAQYNYDPYGLQCRIFTVEELAPGRPVRAGQELTQAEAEASVRAGGDVLVTGGTKRERRETASAIADAAGGGNGTMFHPRTASAGHGTLAHHHPLDAAGEKMPGHVFIDDSGRSGSPFH
jgi:RHS repeat-associated protein